MCRSIKTLRPPFTEVVTEAEIWAAALQYVRKVSGFRTPSAHDAQDFEVAVAAVAEASAALLAAMEMRRAQRRSSTRTQEAARANRESQVSRGASSAAASAR
jgi:hypothetical protein